MKLPNSMLLSALMTILPHAGLARASEVWFSFPPHADFASLFRKPNEWTSALKGANAFMLQSSYIMNASDVALEEVFTFLDSHNIKTALEAPMLEVGPDGCGTGIEGYKPLNYMRTVFERIHQLGGHLYYVAMDEPLWFGHLSVRRQGPYRPCNLPIEGVARNVAKNVRYLHQRFPGALVGSEETIRSPAIDHAMIDDYDLNVRRWMKAYKTYTGSPLDFINWDVVWFPQRTERADKSANNYWQSELRRMFDIDRQVGIRTGIFYNGDPNEASSEAWNKHAVVRFKTVEGALGLKPDVAVFATWMSYPNKALPETQPGTMTSLVLSYLSLTPQ